MQRSRWSRRTKLAVAKTECARVFDLMMKKRKPETDTDQNHEQDDKKQGRVSDAP